MDKELAIGGAPFMVKEITEFLQRWEEYLKQSDEEVTQAERFRACINSSKINNGMSTSQAVRMIFHVLSPHNISKEVLSSLVESIFNIK
jgi:hypothetical protein